MNYLSVCSGIEAATCAWHDLGWTPEAFSEIEKFPSEVLAHHYPAVPNLGDMTEFKEWNLEPIDLLVGGTPCQSFSVAGLRKGLDDPRGNLALVYLAIADRFKPKWLVWENVPGVLSSNGGRDFSSFLGALAQLGYGFSYRVLDAQYFGVAQRRRRVFVVGYLGDWRPAAAVLFESESLRGGSPPSRETREEVAKCLTTGIGKRYDSETDTMIPMAVDVYNQTIDGQTAATLTMACGGTNTSGPKVMQPIAFGAQNSSSQGDSVSTEVTPTLDKSKTPAVAFSAGQSSQAGSLGLREEQAPTLRGGASGTNMTPTILKDMSVRRLTPTECERLQGFPDGYTDVRTTTPDGPRYKALGNSMAVPVMKWIGERIQKFEELNESTKSKRVSHLPTEQSASS